MIYIDVKFLRLMSSQLSGFKQKADNLFLFRCPICGDSEKNQYKARGYVYKLKDSLLFKCHNCGDSRSLGSLIKTVNPELHKQYVMERYRSGSVKPRKPPAPERNKFVAPVFHQKTPDKMLTSIGAVRLDKLPTDHPANKFVRSRKLPWKSFKILYYVDDESKLADLSDKYKNRVAGHSPRIVIPFCDLDGNMVGLTARVLTDTGLRYLMMKFNGDMESMYFGLERWDPKKPTYVVEGPLDSLFIDNCISIGGADFGKLNGVVDPKSTTLIYDREPRNREIVTNMDKSIDAGYNICVMPNTLKGKDINDYVLAGHDVNDLISNNTYSGLQAKMHLTTWRKI